MRKPLNELHDYFVEMVSLKSRQIEQVSSAPGEANRIDGERDAYQHAADMVWEYLKDDPAVEAHLTSK